MTNYARARCCKKLIVIGEAPAREVKRSLARRLFAYGLGADPASNNAEAQSGR